MSLKIAVQMDPIARINIRGDSTFAMLLEAQKRGHAISYYHPESPMARGVAVVRAIKGSDGAPVTVGVIGLGTGSMACHAEAGDTWRIFEIDPLMVKIAKDAERFRMLSTCLPDADIVLGDARLTLTREPPASFDYIIVDAFSSDAIPIHLLTLEAIQLYMSKLTDKGVLALHGDWVFP